MPTRCRGGKGPGSTLPGSVVDHLDPVLFVPTAEVPDRRSLHLETVGQLLHHGRWIRHGQQDPRSPRHPLLGASIVDEVFEVSCVLAGQFDRAWRSPSHPRGLAAPRDYVERLIKQSTRGAPAGLAWGFRPPVVVRRLSSAVFRPPSPSPIFVRVFVRVRVRDPVGDQTEHARGGRVTEMRDRVDHSSRPQPPDHYRHGRSAPPRARPYLSPTPVSLPERLAPVGA